jgi:hypothetical protein
MTAMGPKGALRCEPPYAFSVELASSCDERFLRKRETPIAQKVGIEVGSSAVGKCPNGALSLVDASILQQRGHGRSHQLKPNVVGRWERDRFRHCTNVDLFELCCGKQNPDFIVARKDMLGSFDACCVRPQAIIKRPGKRMCPWRALNCAVDTEHNASRRRQRPLHFAESARLIRKELKAELAEDEIKTAVGKGQVERASTHSIDMLVVGRDRAMASIPLLKSNPTSRPLAIF